MDIIIQPEILISCRQRCLEGLKGKKQEDESQYNILGMPTLYLWFMIMKVVVRKRTIGSGSDKRWGRSQTQVRWSCDCHIGSCDPSLHQTCWFQLGVGLARGGGGVQVEHRPRDHELRSEGR